MAIETRGDAAVVTHALARQALTRLRDIETGQIDFRKGLVDLGRICGYELVDARFETEPVRIRTPLCETTGEQVAGLDQVVIVNVLRAATPFVEGLLRAMPLARQGVISAGRNEEAGMDETGQFPIAMDYVKLPRIDPEDTVIVADPMLATGSTMVAVLDQVISDGADPASIVVLSAVAAPPGIERLAETHPAADVVTVAIDDHLDDDGYIVPGLGDAGDRAFGTASEP